MEKMGADEYRNNFQNLKEVTFVYQYKKLLGIWSPVNEEDILPPKRKRSLGTKLGNPNWVKGRVGK